MKAALAIVLAFAGCKPETARQADQAAKDVIEARKGGEPHRRAAAEHRFTDKQRIRIAALRGEHSVIGSQLKMIGVFAQYARITDAGRADVNNHLTEFKRLLDEAKNQIEGLAKTAVDNWQERDDAVREAMDSLESARKAAWRALDDAPRIDSNAS